MKFRLFENLERALRANNEERAEAAKKAARLDEELKLSEIEKNRSEIAKNNSEIEKNKAETKNLKKEGWTKAYTNIVSWALLIKAIVDYLPKLLQAIGFELPWQWPW